MSFCCRVDYFSSLSVKIHLCIVLLVSSAFAFVYVLIISVQYFKNQNKQWNKALCMADSDGDGLTNGEELGDPHCTWPGQSAGKPLGHPGNNIFCSKLENISLRKNFHNNLAAFREIMNLL